MLSKSKSKLQSGFTLIELLVVIGILAVLLAIVLVAINPAKHFADANNTQRRSDVNAILNAIHQYAAANKGALPAGLLVTDQVLASTGASTINLCSVLTPTYIADLPTDPTTGTRTPAGSTCATATSYNSNYAVKTTAANRVTVTAPGTEGGGTTITVTR